MRVAILANVPVWTLPGLEYLYHSRHYATWLEPLIPAFESATKGVDVHWITMCKETRLPIEHYACGQTFHILPRKKMSVSMITAYLAENQRIGQVIKHIQPDLVHAWGSEDVYGIAGARSGIKRRLFTLQGSLTEYLRLIGGGALFRLQAAYERPTVNRYRHGTAESPAARDLLLKLNPDMHVNLVDYGVNSEFYESRWEPAIEPEVLFLGSVSRRKGILDLVSLARLAELSHVRFLIAGEGDLRVKLESTSPPNVVWLGKCNRAQVIGHMSRAWALIMPTYADTGPTVIKEARVVGLPVITTTGAGASCYVHDSKSGFVTQPGDTKALASAIMEVCKNRERCIGMGRFDWEKQRLQLRPSTTACAFTKIYKSLLNI